MKKAHEEKKKEKNGAPNRLRKTGRFMSKSPAVLVGLVILAGILIPGLFAVHRQAEKADESARYWFYAAMRQFDAGDFRATDPRWYSDTYIESNARTRYVYENIDRKTESFMPYYSECARTFVLEIEKKGLAGTLGMNEETSDLIWKGLEEQYVDQTPSDIEYSRPLKIIYDYQVLYGGFLVQNETDMQIFTDVCSDISRILEDSDINIYILDEIQEHAKAIRREQAAEPQMQTQ